MKLKPLDIHITNSSASLDKLIEQIVMDEIVSKTKSLDETASNEFCIGLLKPRDFVVIFLFIGKEVPDNAPDPSGFSFNLLLQSINLLLSLDNISTYARR